MAGWRSLVRGGAPYRPAAGDSDPPFALSISSPEFLPRILTSNEKAALLLFGIGWGLVGGLLEELGWTGFTVPTLLR